MGGNRGAEHASDGRATDGRTDGVVVAAPLFNEDLGLGEGVEHLHVEQLIAELAVEALHIAVTGHDGPGASVSRHVGVAVYGATIRDTGHREHVECGQAVRWK